VSICPYRSPPYPPEFKTEAVRLYQQSGKNLQEIASDLGVSTNPWPSQGRVGQTD
jgi:transposase-like protein